MERGAQKGATGRGEVRGVQLSSRREAGCQKEGKKTRKNQNGKKEKDF